MAEKIKTIGNKGNPASECPRCLAICADRNALELHKQWHQRLDQQIAALRNAVETIRKIG